MTTTPSILTSVKKVLNIDVSVTVFDQDILLFINTAFARLNQLGIGPDDGFMIEDAAAVWDDYLDGDLRYNNVQTYIALSVRLLFDPPTTSYLLTSMQNQMEKFESLLSVLREGDKWTPPPIVV